MTSDEERMAMLAGRSLDALDAEERQQVASWTQLLADEDLWADPAPDLEGMVVASIANAPRPSRGWGRTSRSAHSWVRPLLAGLAAAAAVVAAVVLFTRDTGGQDSFASAVLSGTDLAADATGKAMMYADSGGFRIELKADNLPLLDGGRFYQAWLKGPNGLLPIGTFSEGNGDWVTLWSGLSPKDFPTISVTIESPDGNQESSGQRVLVGDATAS